MPSSVFTNLLKVFVAGVVLILFTIVLFNNVYLWSPNPQHYRILDNSDNPDSLDLFHQYSLAYPSSILTTTKSYNNSYYHHEFDDVCGSFATVNNSQCTFVQKNSRHGLDKERALNIVSGSPGSGNDWILWLGAVNDASLSHSTLQRKCSVYHTVMSHRDSQGHLLASCLFLKSHEPWWGDRANQVTQHSAEKVAVLLRHPFDSALSEFKRMQVKGTATLKSATVGITLNKFFSNDDMTVPKDSRWYKYALHHVQKWLNHAKFWLERYEGQEPYIIIYKNFVDDTRNGLASLLRYFNMTQTEQNLRRSCCSAMYPFNRELKRGKTPVDQYKELLFSQTPDLERNAEAAVFEVNQLLARKYPGSSFRIRRG